MAAHLLAGHLARCTFQLASQYGKSRSLRSSGSPSRAIRDTCFRDGRTRIRSISTHQRRSRLSLAPPLAEPAATAHDSAPVADADEDVVAHSQRVGELAGALALELGWGLTRCERLVEAAAAHDEGKAMIPPAILEKPSVLSAVEYAQVTQHALHGARSLEPFLSIEQLGWVLHHHERWDGLGYPDGLAGDEIPQGARILGVADSWDAMTSNRSYRPTLGPGAAMAECWRCSGSQFDPEVVKALTRVRPQPAALVS